MVTEAKSYDCSKDQTVSSRSALVLRTAFGTTRVKCFRPCTAFSKHCYLSEGGAPQRSMVLRQSVNLHIMEDNCVPGTIQKYG